MDAPNQDFALAGSLEELKQKGRLVVPGRDRPILVIHDRGRVFALDNRCPHWNLPLAGGSVKDGILTCPWHQARFDLESGRTFDLWAGDVPVCPVELRNGEVWVKTTFGHPTAYWRQRLADGLAHDLGDVIAKAVRGQLTADIPAADIVRQVALFGVQNRDSWGVGLTILTALANLLPMLPEDEAYLALVHGARQVAADYDGAPRRDRAPLASPPDPLALKRSLRRWTIARDREAAERVLLTAIAAGAAPAVLADILLAATTGRTFADTGHALDVTNKALECLDLIGWEHAAAVLPTVVGQMVMARGAEESTAWCQPVDLVALCKEATSQLPNLFADARGAHNASSRAFTPVHSASKTRVDALTDGLRTRITRAYSWSDHAALAGEMLGDDPARIVDAIMAAIRAGAAPADLGRSLAYGAALRMARFDNTNEHAGWETVRRVFIYANAVHRMLERIGAADSDGQVTAVRSVLHGAMALYLARHLNVPPRRIPGEDGMLLDDLPADADAIRAVLLDALRQRQVDLAARLVARHLTLGHSPQALIATLARARLREDAGIRAYQLLEAGIRQFTAWGDSEAGRYILIAVARYLAAHSPAERPRRLRSARPKIASMTSPARAIVR